MLQALRWASCCGLAPLWPFALCFKRATPRAFSLGFFQIGLLSFPSFRASLPLSKRRSVTARHRELRERRDIACSKHDQRVGSHTGQLRARQRFWCHLCGLALAKTPIAYPPGLGTQHYTLQLHWPSHPSSNPDVTMAIKEVYIAGPGGPYKNLTSSPRYGDREWDYRARKAPLRQRPEWQLSDADVVDVGASLDLCLLQKTCPSTLAKVVQTLVSSLARLPLLSKHVHRFECRLASIMHATIAMPLPGRFRVHQWLDCRKRIRRVWLKWGGRLTDRLGEGRGLPPTAPPSDWLRQAHELLKSIGIHILGCAW